uniref:Odorant receptor n=1 Tax=Drosophila pseudoobscura pseudoobscura TaxID=46245 RepID=B5DXV9_DROPS|nr:odorant receptor [Drosophila pseudoobscura pseudoobscura]CBW30705.1 odorant receptor [Drosophila pseudoobscura pseudoobscura]CBW30706.1 odorant receptor [Drosophila pseudoobscura pseudoobscura]
MSVKFLKEKIFSRRGKSEKPKNAYIVIEDFMKLPIYFYRTIGLNPYELTGTNNKPGIGFHILFLLHMINANMVLALEIFFVYVSFRNNENFIESCMVMSYIGFVIVGDLKIGAVLLQKQKLTNLVRQMESVFPPARQKEQEEYDVRRYLRRCLRYTKGFGGLYMTLVITYNLFAICQYSIQKWILHSPHAKQSVPYVPLTPWTWQDNWKFYPTYLSQSMAGYTATCGHISADLMIFAVAIQVIMHFDRLAKSLTEFTVRAQSEEDGAEKDLKKLQELIAYHNKILGLTDVMNEVFGLALLLNFLASSTLVCFVGFQISIGISPEMLAKLILILISANSEIYLICNFSQMLIDASGSICYAVYDMNWSEADPRFRKMLIVLALRAQKPVCLTATVFLDISIETMSIFLRMSYKFFCAIRTMYQ